MIRNILIGVVGILLTGILISLTGWLVLNVSHQGELVRDLHTGTISTEQFAGAFFDRSERLILISEIVVFPLIALAVGCFVGMFARERVWLPALIAISPIFIFLLSVPTLKGLSLCAVYIALVVAIATIISRRRFARQRNIPPIEN